MQAEAFDYDLPSAAIAQQPCEPRGASRLLVDGDPMKHGSIRDLPSLLRPGDVLVVNDTRVLPARLLLNKPTGGRVEVLVLEEDNAVVSADTKRNQGGWWTALVRPSGRVANGTHLLDGQERLVLEVGSELEDGTRLVRSIGQSMQELLNSQGVLPLPPYIESTLRDSDRYQTVYAKKASSVAAPTAGLHLTGEVLDRCKKAGAQIYSVELSIGIGTFRPLRGGALSDQQMHSERYRVDASVMNACLAADRVVAVGTTVVRALESAAVSGSLEGRTDLFIQPGFEFRVVDALITNFHLPRSTLLVMIEAFIGTRWRVLYEEALSGGYRFLSFGDAMFVFCTSRKETVDGRKPHGSR